MAAYKGASNRLVAVENLTEEALTVLQQHFLTMATYIKSATNLRQSHSVEEAIKEASEKLETEPGHPAYETS